MQSFFLWTKMLQRHVVSTKWTLLSISTFLFRWENPIVNSHTHCHFKKLQHAAIALLCVLYSQINTMQSLFYKLLNQYQACLYSFECISHDDSKYSHQIPELLHF